MQAETLTCMCLSLLALTHQMSAYPYEDRRENAIHGNTVRHQDISTLQKDLDRCRRLSPNDVLNEDSEDAVDGERRPKRQIGLLMKDYRFNHRQYNRGRQINRDRQQPRSNIVPM